MKNILILTQIPMGGKLKKKTLHFITFVHSKHIVRIPH